MSKEISDACYPITVKVSKEMRNGVLVLNVIHGRELHIEYQKNQIIDQINSFFGYKCISSITLKIIQKSIEKNKKIFPKIKNLDMIYKRMGKVKDIKLKQSLNDFLKVYNEKNK